MGRPGGEEQGGYQLRVLHLSKVDWVSLDFLEEKE
jgi:hypothetical protein